MHTTRSLTVLTAAMVSVAALAAGCTSAVSPGWTYTPASPSAAASGQPSGSPPASPAETTASFEPSGSAAASPSQPSGSAPTGGEALTLIALNITFDKKELTTPAGEPFTIEFDNQDDGQMHDVDIRDAAGTVIKDQPTVTGPAQETYQYEPLEAGEYVFICSIHPIDQMTGQLIVE